ncbi:tetratricopeptide repeat protein [Ornithinibacillus californiensis]|uniref:tetratricopeptide repeat protein n=1 Tax=Ornithinibacillus californiensis TaxID=161536 RepID=UPI00064D8003|nr:hypothetical protein [Ornithinibacillus californiensis]
MTTENELINKSYYQSLIDKSQQGHPIKILGEMYMEEMQKERPELSAIRYAQGEVYFLNSDYEAAIYKWQHPLEGTLFPWAQKNIADAHLEMGLLEFAEKAYKEVQTQSSELQSEVLLQLFSLYIQQNETKKAVDTIKEAVKINPDYSRVTEIAQTYFEDIQDWDHAIELAVNEAIRTKSLTWVEILEGYAKHGLTSNVIPNYFNELLKELIHLDVYRFESLTEAIWNSYSQTEFYPQWINEFNQLLLQLEMEETYEWKKLPNIFKDTYFSLISGKFLIRDISELIHMHLPNWLKLSSTSDGLLPSTAILAWDEIFPSELDANLISEAEQLFNSSTPVENGKQDGMKIFESIKLWAEKEGLLEEFLEFTEPKLAEYNMEVASPSGIRNLIKATVEFLIEQRVVMKNNIMEEINWNEDLLLELEDIQERLGNLEKEKASNMANSFNDIKEKLNENVMSKLPKILKYCSELVQEDSDFSKLHIILNEEMNKRIAHYMGNAVLHDYKHAVKNWLEDCKQELQDAQITSDEFSETINQKMTDGKIVLQGDFKVLEDWQRDMDRISRGLVQREKVNIMLKRNPSQLFLKGAGKLFGSINRNNDMLYSKYKSYIENADYSEIAEEIIRPFIQQLELFESSIEWDVNRFFSNPQEVLHRVVEGVQVDIVKHKDALNTMLEKPEMYQDPLTLFEIKLRQYELMNVIS